MLKAKFKIVTGSSIWGKLYGNIMEQQDLQDELNSISGGLADSITALDDKFTSITGGLDDKIDSVSGALSDSITGLDNKYDSITGALSDSITGLDNKYDSITGALSDSITGLDNKYDSITGGLADSITGLDNKYDSITGALDNKIDNHIANTNNPHSVTKTQVGLGNVDNTSDLDKPVSTAQQTALDNKVTKNADITAATKCKITYDVKGLVTGGADLQQSDIPSLNLTKISDVTATYTEINQLHESGAVKADFEKLHAITADATELNILDGVTASTSEINTLDGLTASTAELNILDGATVTTAELNILDGATLSTTELNYVDGVTSAIQTQFDNITDLIPAQATDTNQLADKDFVNSSIATNTAVFRGTFASVSALEAYSGTVTNNDYAFVTNGVIEDNGGDWATFAALDAYNKDLLTNLDYAWVVNGSNFDLYRFDILNQTWELRVQNTPKSAVTLNNAYNRYKATVENNVVTWEWEYTLNNSSFTAAQWAAINSGITSATKVTHTANTAIGNSTTPVYVDASGNATALSCTLATSVPVGAVFTDTTYTITTGSANGTIAVSVNGGAASDVSVKGLGSAAYTPSTDYATSIQGGLADTAIQPNDDITELNNNAGYIKASDIPLQETKVPIVYYQPTDSYCYDESNNRFYGSHVTEKLYLVQPKTSGTTQVIDMSTTFSLSFTINYIAAPSNSITVGEIIASYSSGKGLLLQLNSTGLYYKNNVTGTTITGTRALTAGNSYDIKAEYDGAHMIISYKLSSEVNYTQINSTTCTCDGSNYNYAAIGMDANYGSMALSSVVLTNGANTLYSYTSGKIALDYDSTLGLNALNQLKAVSLTGLTATIAELNYVDGVTSSIQTQLNGKLTSSDIVSSVDSSSTNSKAVGAKLFYDTCGDIETLINAL